MLSPNTKILQFPVRNSTKQDVVVQSVLVYLCCLRLLGTQAAAACSARPRHGHANGQPPSCIQVTRCSPPCSNFGKIIPRLNWKSLMGDRKQHFNFNLSFKCWWLLRDQSIFESGHSFATFTLNLLFIQAYRKQHCRILNPHPYSWKAALWTFAINQSKKDRLRQTHSSQESICLAFPLEWYNWITLG